MRKHLAISLLFLLFAVLGCSTINDLGRSAENTAGNSEGGDTQNPADIADAGDFAPSDDPSADIERAGKRFLERETFRAVMESTGKTPAKMELEFQRPDRFRMTNHYDKGETVEIVTIGDKTYMNSKGRWMVSPISMNGTTMTDMVDMFSRKKSDWFQDLKFSGEDTVDGKAAYVYEYTGKADGMNESASKIWVGKADGMPIKIESEYKSGDMKTFKIVYDYDTAVSIEAPIK